MEKDPKIESLKELQPNPIHKDLDKLVEDWFVETFHNLGLAVQHYNHFQEKKEILKNKLKQFLKG